MNPIYSNSIRLVTSPNEVVLEFSAKYSDSENDATIIAMTHATYQSLKDLINKEPETEEE